MVISKGQAMDIYPRRIIANKLQDKKMKEELELDICKCCGKKTHYKDFCLRCDGELSVLPLGFRLKLKTKLRERE